MQLVRELQNFKFFCELKKFQGSGNGEIGKSEKSMRCGSAKLNFENIEDV
jgi:hypothetical protein